MGSVLGSISESLYLLLSEREYKLLFIGVEVDASNIGGACAVDFICSVFVLMTHCFSVYAVTLMRYVKRGIIYLNQVHNSSDLIFTYKKFNQKLTELRCRFYSFVDAVVFTLILSFFGKSHFSFVSSFIRLFVWSFL